MSKHRLFSLFLCAVVLLSGCTGTDNSAEPGGTNIGSNANTISPKENADPDTETLSGEVTVWVHPYADASLMNPVYTEIEKQFETSNPDLDVIVQEIPWANREQKLLTALAAGEGPDIFYLLPDQTPQFAEQGILEPITQYVSDDLLSAFTPTSLDTARYKDELYGLPILQTVVSPYYNLELLTKAGGDRNALPQTMDDIMALCPKVKAEGKYCFTFAASAPPNTDIYRYIWSYGGEIINESGEIVFNSPETVNAYKFIKEAYDNGYIHPDVTTDAAATNEFYTGNTLVGFMPNSFVSIGRSDQISFEWSIGPILRNTKQVTFGTTGSFVVPATSENKEAAIELLKFITNEENQRMFNKASGFLPANKKAQDIFSGDDVMEIVAGQTQFTIAGVKDPIARTINAPVIAGLQAMLAGGDSPETAVKATQEAIQAARDANP